MSVEDLSKRKNTHLLSRNIVRRISCGAATREAMHTSAEDITKDLGAILRRRWSMFIDGMKVPDVGHGICDQERADCCQVRLTALILR